jgi:WD40 repeat protein
MSDEPAMAAPELDIKSTHVWNQWKYSSPCIGCRCDPTGRFVFASAMDNTIQRWDLASDQHAAMGGHDSWLRAIGFSADGRQTFTAGYDGRLCFWQTESMDIEPTRTITAHDGWVRGLSVHPSGNVLATGGNDRLVKLWSAETGELIHVLQGHEKHVYSVLFHPEGELLLTGDLAGLVHQWEVTTGKLIRTLDAKALYSYNGGQQVDYGGVRCMAWSVDLQQLACGGLHKGTNPFAGVQEPLVLIFDWASGQQVRTHESTGIERGIVWRLAYQADGTLTGASGGGSGGFLLFWHTDKTEVHKFKLPNTILDMDMHPNGLDAVTVHHDGHIRISRMAAKA